jgi:hypothetical protein
MAMWLKERVPEPGKAPTNLIDNDVCIPGTPGKMWLLLYIL